MAKKTQITSFGENPLTKRKLLVVYKNDRAISRAVRLAPSYICKWGMDDAIPEIAELRLRYIDAKDTDWDAIAALDLKQ